MPLSLPEQADLRYYLGRPALKLAVWDEFEHINLDRATINFTPPMEARVRGHLQALRGYEQRLMDMVACASVVGAGNGVTLDHRQGRCMLINEALRVTRAMAGYLGVIQWVSPFSSGTLGSPTQRG